MVRNRLPARDRPWRRSGGLRHALSRIRGIAKSPVTVTDPPEDLEVERDVAVTTRDATVLRINVFRRAGIGDRLIVLNIHRYGPSRHKNTNAPRKTGAFASQCQCEMCRVAACLRNRCRGAVVGSGSLGVWLILRLPPVGGWR